jgi:hypothetical protein
MKVNSCHPSWKIWMNTTDVLMSSLIRIIFTNLSQREITPNLTIHNTTSLPDRKASLKKALMKTRIKINLNNRQILYPKPMLSLQVQSHLRQIDSNNTKTSSLPLLSNWKCKAYLYLKIKKINQRKNW